MCTLHGNLSRCRDARRRFAIVVVLWFSRVICATYIIYVGVVLPSSWGFSWLDLEFWVGVATISVASLGIGFPASVVWHPSAHMRYLLNLVSASRRLASVFERLVLWQTRLIFSVYGILCRRLLAFISRCPVWRFEAPLRFIRNIMSASERWSSRRSASVRKHCAIWRPEAVIVLFGILCQLRISIDVTYGAPILVFD
jgi:hypothetical protein